jgi:hypothetical protein
MRSEIESASASRVPAGMCVSLLLVVSLVLAAAAGSGYLGARWAAESLSAELALRPPVILFDLAAAVRGAGPEQLAAVVAREKKQAERLAAGGFLVLDAQAVIAAPPELYLSPDIILEGTGEPPQ